MFATAQGLGMRRVRIFVSSPSDVEFDVVVIVSRIGVSTVLVRHGVILAVLAVAAALLWRLVRKAPA